MKCPKCGAEVETAAEDKAEGGKEESEVEISIEGDPGTIREILDKLLPKAAKAK